MSERTESNARPSPSFRPIRACNVCTVIASDMRPGETVTCSCGAILTDMRERATVAKRPPRNTRLALLAVCAAIARWDAIANPRSVTLVSDNGNSGGGARVESTDRRDWESDNHDAIARCGDTRDRLNQLWSHGRSDTRMLEVLWLLGWVVRYDAQAGETADVAADAPTISRTQRAAAVIEWLVPRAKVVLDSAHGQKGTPVLKSLPREIGRAFASRDQLARWNPPLPIKPARPREPACESLVPIAPRAPAVDEVSERAYPGRTDDLRDARAYQGRRAAYEIASAETNRAERVLLEYATALETYERDVKAWQERVRGWDSGPEMRRHAEQREAGRVGAERHGNELLLLAERVWFGG